MKLIIEKNKLNENPETILRRAGFGYIYSRATEHGSYVRRLTRDHYPRLHLYLEEAGDRVIFDLHLDQKQASYQGARMHNAEHSGTVVEGEIGRLRMMIDEGVRVEKLVTPVSKRKWWQIF